MTAAERKAQSANDREIARRRKALADAMDAEEYGIYKRTRARVALVGRPPVKSDGSVGKRTGQTKRNYRRTAPATAQTTEIWANRVA